MKIIQYCAGSMLFLFVICLALRLSYGSTRLDMKKQTIIAERSSKKGVTVFLAADENDVVHEIAVGLPGTQAEPKILSNLGPRLVASGKMVLADTLPKDKVATMVRRASLRDGSIIHAVVAWGFPDPDSLTLFCQLYIFREKDGKFEQIYDEELGSEINQFVVEDLNHDGKVEVLAATGENEVALMYVWQIQPDGEVREIQKIEGYSVHTQADRFLDQEPEITVEHKIDCPMAAAICYKIDNYKWSAKKQQFVR